jgi:hypothetical protein
MTIRILSLALLTLTSSCGILGVYKEDVNRDPDFQAKAIAELNDKKIAKEMDSLIRKIDSARVAIPTDLNETTLIIETYEYSDFLKVSENKFHTPKDDKQNRRYYEKYKKDKNSLINKPKYKIVYLDKSKYDTLDVNDYRYVLKTSNRINYDPNHITVANDGFIYPFISTRLYFIYDRKTQDVYKEIVDLSVLSKD